MRAAARSLLRHATAVYLGAIAIVTALLLAAARRLRAAAPAPTPRRAGRGRAARAAAGERLRDRVRPARGGRTLVGPRRLPRLDFSDGRARHARARWSIVPTMLTSVAGRRRAARAPRGAGARQPRPVHPLRHPQRLRRHATRRRRAGRRGHPRARARGHRGAQPQVRRRARPTASSCSTATGSGTRASTRGWAGSASAARSRSSTGCCAAPPTPASRRRSATSTLLPSVRYCITLDSDTRLPRDAAQAADRHHRAPAEPAAVRSARSGASPRATASCSRASA